MLHRLEMENATGVTDLKIVGYRQLKFSPVSPLSMMQLSPIVTVIFGIEATEKVKRDTPEFADKDGYIAVSFLAVEFDCDHSTFGCSYFTDRTTGGIPVDVTRDQKQILTRVMGKDWLDDRRSQIRQKLEEKYES